MLCLPAPGISCVCAENPFYPHLQLHDFITDSLTDYENLYEIKVVAGGLTFDTMVDYTEDVRP